ncbi:hypothetical protein [Mesomycoplasma neurolyticum]|uniref:Lipoprotein n=1 Tax=Mesomycoplasma neurolyticum TaxID=2120 RepID=A0A449A5E4_9BACT|nr:hypothetical protein [Mesomycoplasma neurolyticum]VEU59373.1 Uncharacterised protein [Mesomycoplasma neurolyticum]
MKNKRKLLFLMTPILIATPLSIVACKNEKEEVVKKPQTTNVTTPTAPSTSTNSPITTPPNSSNINEIDDEENAENEIDNEENNEVENEENAFEELENAENDSKKEKILKKIKNFSSIAEKFINKNIELVKKIFNNSNKETLKNAFSELKIKRINKKNVSEFKNFVNEKLTNENKEKFWKVLFMVAGWINKKHDYKSEYEFWKVLNNDKKIKKLKYLAILKISFFVIEKVAKMYFNKI